MFSPVRHIFIDKTNSFLKDDGFRHEVKYTLSLHQYLKFRDFCSGFMELDKNAGENGEYIVKSYYFDTLFFNDYTEKLNGINERKKYRLRTYGDSGFVRLEKKVKRGYLNKKKFGEINADFADMLLKGYTNIKTGNDTTDEIISEMYLNGYRSSVYIEYSRQAFTFDEFDIRITLDTDLGTLYGNYGCGENKPCLLPVSYEGEAILEVKYKETLPRWLMKAVYQMAPSECSLSKYAQSLASILRYQ